MFGIFYIVRTSENETFIVCFLFFNHTKILLLPPKQCKLPCNLTTKCMFASGWNVILWLQSTSHYERDYWVNFFMSLSLWFKSKYSVCIFSRLFFSRGWALCQFKYLLQNKYNKWLMDSNDSEPAIVLISCERNQPFAYLTHWWRGQAAMHTSMWFITVQNEEIFLNCSGWKETKSYVPTLALFNYWTERKSLFNLEDVYKKS